MKTHNYDGRIKENKKKKTEYIENNNLTTTTENFIYCYYFGKKY